MQRGKNDWSRVRGGGGYTNCFGGVGFKALMTNQFKMHMSTNKAHVSSICTTWMKVEYISELNLSATLAPINMNEAHTYTCHQ